jgi:hypothetical protein
MVEEVNYIYNDNKNEIEKILKQIRQASKNNQNLEICVTIYKRFKAMYSKDINIDGKKIEMTIVIDGKTDNKNQCYRQEIITNKYHVSPTNRAFGRNGAFRNIYIEDAQNPKKYLLITVKEEDFHLVGKYLFQDKWQNGFSPNDRKWVLYMFSPNLSYKFKKADGDLLEQRRITYWALTHKFTDDNGNEATWTLSQFKKNPYNYGAKLSYNSFGDDGLTIYFYEKNTYGIIQLSQKYRIYKPYENNSLISDFEISDAFYPVDVKLYDGEDCPSLGKTYYNLYDFNGIYTEATIFGGPIVGGVGHIIGRLKGFGVVEYGYDILQEGGMVYNIEAGISAGLISGKYYGKGVATPLNFGGISISSFLSGGGLTTADWSSEKGDWTGKIVGKSFSVDFVKYLVFTKGTVKSKSYIVFPKLSDKTKNIFSKNSNYYAN